MSLVDLVAKLEKLPPEKQAVVEEFVDFLASKQPAEEKKPVFGSFKGKITMSEDFDEPLEDFKEYMYP
ncbi:MAG: DUF2281 domain-containing protein [Spirosomaceae bacterium]|jgi:hypothetical protein|nr:DUF2281 domain-containing protein [Spirosomataceae bacterium]